MTLTKLRRTAIVDLVPLALLGLLIAATPAQCDWLRPRADGLVDDFEGRLTWRPRSDGGHPPKTQITTKNPHSGRRCLRIRYTDRPPHWGSIEKRIAITGQETALVLWLRVEQAEPKAAMHVWLMEKDGDGWLARVRVGDKTTLAEFPRGQWVRVRMPLSQFKFQPRGRRTPELGQVSVIVLNFNFASSTVCVDDIRFEVPPQVQAMLQAQRKRDEKMRQQVMARIRPQRSRKGNVAVFRDQVPPPKEGTPSDPEYLAELLRNRGYGVAFLSAREMAAPGVLDPAIFDLLVLPYGPRFPNEAADALREYLREGGRFISLGGYAFDEPYFIDRTKQDRQLISNGSFEQAAKNEPDRPAGWALPKAAGLTARRDTSQARSGRASLYMAAADQAPVTWYIARWRVDRPDRSHRYRLSAYVKVRNIHDGPGAYIGVDFYRAGGSRISFVQTHILGRTDDWTALAVEFSVPDGTDYMTLNCILYAHGEAWFDDVELRPVPHSINARHALARDMLHISEDQIPIFDPSFRLERVAEVRAADGQFVAPADLKLRGPLHGYAAVGLWGQNTAVNPRPYARWTPLLRAYDGFGHLRGTVGAVMFHHDGPWQGSAWAFFGATDVDLFRRGDEKMARLFVRLVEHMLRGVYLSCPEPAFMCYRDGEQVSATVLVGNNGRSAQTVAVRAEIFDAAGKRVVSAQQKSLVLKRGEQVAADFNFPRFGFASDLYEIRFTAAVADEAVDQVSTGFCVWREQVVAQGPDVRWRDNSFHIGDAGAGSFLCGTNQTGVVLGPWWENPLTWAREFEYMHDWGLRVLRVLHISHFAGDLADPDEKFLRRMDALVYMTQRHGLVLFPCMHDWLGGISIPDDVLRLEARFAQILAERYRHVPGIIIDIENEAGVAANDHPELRAMFNDFLRELYRGDEAALKRTWGQDARFGQVPFKRPPVGRKWGDLRWLDLNLFRRRLVERWLRANVEAMRAVDRRHAITDEYYLLPAGDAGAANRFCDFVNIHCYTIDRPEQLKYYDHSAEDMGFAVGEFSRRSHPSFVHGWGWASEPEVRRWYMHLVCACLGAGGSLACNWDWKDMESCIFPWGLVYPCDLVPKGQFYVFRALSETLRHLKLTYAPPRVYVLIPDIHALAGPDDHAGWPPARRCIKALLQLGVPFGVLHDTNIAKLPAEARVVFYPSPFALGDETFRALADFVRRGGTLYISGDLSYDERLRRTRAGRLAELCGVEDRGPIYPPDALPEQQPTVDVQTGGLDRLTAAPCVKVRPGAATVLATAGPVPALLENRVGGGRVIFCTAPLELFDGGPPPQLYSFVLRRGGVRPIEVGGNDGRLVVMLRPQRQGQIAAIYRDDADTPAEVSLLGARVRIVPRNWAIVATDAAGEPYVLAGQGLVAGGGLEVHLAQDEPVLVAADGAFTNAGEITMCIVPIHVDPYDSVSVTLKWRRAANGVRVEAGEIAGGRWRALVYCKAQQASGAWKFSAPAGLILRIRAR